MMRGTTRRGVRIVSVPLNAWGLLMSGLALALLTACGDKQVILPGERFPVSMPLQDSLPQDGQPAPRAPQPDANRSVPISLPAPVTLADWPQRGSNARHLAPNSALSANPIRIFSAPIGEGNSRRFRIAAAPVVAGGRIFTLDARTTVTATSTGGAALWQASAAPAFNADNANSGGGLAFAEGRLFVTTAFGELLALDPASGGVIWRQRFGAPVTAAPTVADGIVYGVARNSSAWAVNASDGTLRWQVPGAPAVAGALISASPAVTDRLVILPFPSGEVVGVLRNGGAQIWSGFVRGERVGRGYAEVASLGASPVVSGATTFVGNLSGRTVALATDTGARIWTAKEGAFSDLAVGGGSVFLVNDEARLVRLNAATGETIWSVELPYFVNPKPRRREGIFAHYGPILAGGRVAVASSDGMLRFFSPTDGRLVGTAAIPGGAAAPPVVAGGVLYVVGTGGQLHAFR